MNLNKFKKWIVGVLFVLFGMMAFSASAYDLDVVHIGDSHVSSKIFPRATHSRLRQRLPNKVSYQIVAKPGAYLADFLNQGYLNKVTAMKPNLIVVSIGTNESYAPNFNQAKFRADMRRFMAMYTPVCRAIVFSTPPGSYKNGQINPKGKLVADILKELAGPLNYWVYDLYGAAGPAYWRNGGMMDRRGVHFNVQGYTKHGVMLGDWIADNVINRK